MLSKEQKTKIIDYLEKLCESSNVSKKTIGNTMRAYHTTFPLYMFILLFYGK